MLELDAWFYLAAVPAVVFAGISKGGFGSGAAFAASSILALLIDPATAVALLLPLLMLMDVSALPPFWRQWNTRDTLRLSVGSVPGVALGAAVFSVANADLIRVVIGLISIGFVIFQAARAYWPPADRAEPLGLFASLIAGTVAGFTSFVAHAGGPPAAIYLLAQGRGKTEYQATTVIVFWIINLLKAAFFTALGLFSAHLIWASITLAPAAILGVWIGVRAHKTISERAFFRVTYVLLTVTGSKLIFDALT